MTRHTSLPLLAVAVTTLIATAAISQQQPDRPGQDRPPRDQTPQRPGDPRPATPAQQQPQQQNVLRSLEGTWTVTMKMPATGAPAQEIRGTATRSWVLDGSVLKEDFMVTSVSGSPTERPGEPLPPRPNEPPRRPGGPNAQDANQPDQHVPEISMGFEGLGLFSIREQTREVSHVWADSHSEGLVLSTGRYDPSARTITFTHHAGELEKPGMEEDRDMDQPAREPGQPGGARADQPTVTLRIVSENQHVITKTKPGAAGRAESYEITYTRQGAAPVRPGENVPRRPATPPDRNNPPRPGGTPDQP